MMTCDERVRTEVHSKLLPGVTAQEMTAIGSELRSDAVFWFGRWIGDVVYEEFRSWDGELVYGWRPVLDRSQPLTCRVLAIRKLPRLNQEARS